MLIISASRHKYSKNFQVAKELDGQATTMWWSCSTPFTLERQSSIWSIDSLETADPSSQFYFDWFVIPIITSWKEHLKRRNLQYNVEMYLFHNQWHEDVLPSSSHNRASSCRSRLFHHCNEWGAWVREPEVGSIRRILSRYLHYFHEILVKQLRELLINVNPLLLETMNN